MVQVTCEKTGLVFEASTKRTKNHPTIMSIINQAYKDGWYAQAAETLKQGRVEGWTTIDQFTSALNQAEAQYTSARKEQIHAEVVREREIKDAKRERFATNAFLREHGYAWKKFENDEEDQDFFNAPSFEWTLYSPDGKPVSVRQAMEQLAPTSNYAKQWLEDHAK